MELVTSSAHKHLSLLLKQREAKQLETVQPFDKALKCGCFSNIKKFQGSLGKKWGHAKRVQKSDILTTRGLQWCRIGFTFQKSFVMRTFQFYLEPVKNESCRHFGWDWKI